MNDVRTIQSTEHFVGRCDVLDVRFVALAHNTIRGAAGGSVLNAELMVAQGMLALFK